MTIIRKRAACATAMLVLTASILSGCTTYGTGVTPEAQTLTDLGGLVNISGPKKASIDYKPRPPLTAPPPGVAPPPPGSGISVASASDWPNDPDAAAKAAKAAGRKRAYDSKTDALYDPGLKLPVQHENHTYMTKRGTGYEDAVAGASDKEKELATRKRIAEAKNSVSFDANGNPIRKTLSDPPVVYREPDPSAPTVFKTKRKFHWPWDKSDRNSAEGGLVDESLSPDNSSNLNKHAPPVQ